MKMLIAVIGTDRRRSLFLDQKPETAQAVIETVADGGGFHLTDAYNGTIAYAPGSVLRVRAKEMK